MSNVPATLCSDPADRQSTELEELLAEIDALEPAWKKAVLKDLDERIDVEIEAGVYVRNGEEEPTVQVNMRFELRCLRDPAAECHRQLVQAVRSYLERVEGRL